MFKIISSPCLPIIFIYLWIVEKMTLVKTGSELFLVISSKNRNLQFHPSLPLSLTIFKCLHFWIKIFRWSPRWWKNLNLLVRNLFFYQKFRISRQKFTVKNLEFSLVFCSEKTHHVFTSVSLEPCSGKNEIGWSRYVRQFLNNFWVFINKRRMWKSKSGNNFFFIFNSAKRDYTGIVPS